MWKEYPDLSTTHPNVPSVTVMDGLPAVIGGGEGQHVPNDGYDKVVYIAAGT